MNIIIKPGSFQTVNGVRYTFTPADPTRYSYGCWDGGVIGGKVKLDSKGNLYVWNHKHLTKGNFKGNFVKAAEYAQKDQYEAFVKAQEMVAAYSEARKGH